MKKSGFLQKQQAFMDFREREVRHHTQVYTLDMVTCALGRIGFREKRLRQFDEMMTQVCKEYADLTLDDVKADKEIVYTKACLDRELKQYAGTMFVPYDERYR